MTSPIRVCKTAADFGRASLIEGDKSLKMSLYTSSSEVQIYEMKLSKTKMQIKTQVNTFNVILIQTDVVQCCL